MEAALGELDITQANILVSVRKGIEEAENIATVKELADLLGGVCACSMLAFDKK